MNDLYLKRASSDTAFIDQTRKVLDEWAAGIPFSPIKSFSTQTEFKGMEEYAIYQTEVVTQEELRWLADHEAPFRGEELPAVYQPKTDFDPWEIDFTPFADFEEHRQSKVIIPTRRVYRCNRCEATGRIRCDSCAGKGDVKCGTCSGSGEVRCRECSGGGQIKRTRWVEKKGSCRVCSGRGTVGLNPPRSCSSCGGKGEAYHRVSEQYFEPCTSCARRGTIKCSRCGGDGRVTCSSCKGSGDVTCPRCKGVGDLISYTTAERTEKPHRANEVFIPAELPKFKTSKSPVSVLNGPTVFKQDESKALVSLDINGQAAESVIQASFLRCRHAGTGRVIRQNLTVARCVIAAWSYRHQGKDHVIYVNPAHGLVEDVDGPIQHCIDGLGVLAAQTFASGSYEDAFAQNQKVLCMNEATESAMSLRKAIFKKLGIHYLVWAFIGWAVSVVLMRLFFASTAERVELPFVFLGLLPLVLGVWVFSRDIALSVRTPRARIPLGLLIGMVAGVSGAAESHAFVVTVIMGWAAVAFKRSKERARRAKIESHSGALGSVAALEKYLEDFGKKQGLVRLSSVTLSAACLLLVIGQMLFPWDSSLRTRLALFGQIGTQPKLSTASQGNHFVIPDLGLEMVPIASGEFTMGSTNGDENEVPTTQVRITGPFWLGRYEVTQSEWSRIMATSPSKWVGDRLPVETVSWDDAMSFCRKLTERENAAGRLPKGFAYTLPSEAQWEYACRAGGNSNFSGTGDLPSMGWYMSNSDGRTHSVGQKRPNGWSLYDMHGNVAEWCLDWYADQLPGGNISDPQGAVSGIYRLVRGGGWYGESNYARSTYRGGGDPTARVPHIGFRIALSVSPEG